MLLRTLVTVFALASVSWPAVAQSCQNPMTQMDMNQCAAAELDHETKRINEIYKDLRKGLDAKTRTDLKNVQLAWIKFKDLACELEASGVEGGTMYPMALASCLAEKSRQRSKELKALKQVL